jgi:hypothetical protein
MGGLASETAASPATPAGAAHGTRAAVAVAPVGQLASGREAGRAGWQPTRRSHAKAAPGVSSGTLTPRYAARAPASMAAMTSPAAATTAASPAAVLRTADCHAHTHAQAGTHAWDKGRQARQPPQQHAHTQADRTQHRQKPRQVMCDEHWPGAAHLLAVQLLQVLCEQRQMARVRGTQLRQQPAVQL